MISGEQKGAVAAGHQLTATSAADMLRKGGNAIDAAVAALVMACVCEPVLCSPGGGGFAMVRTGPDTAPRLIDFFPHTPHHLDESVNDGVLEIVADFGTATQAFHVGPATAASPGFFAGLETLHALGATIAMADLIEPATRAARNGVVVTGFQHYLSSVVEPILTSSDALRALFAPHGRLVRAGETFRNPGLADALEILASGGFAGSAVGEATVLNQLGRGHLCAEDLSAYRTIERRPLSIRAGNSTIHLNPLPSAGGTMIHHSLRHLESSDPVDIAKALRHTDQARAGAGGDLSALDTHNIRQQGTTHISVIDASGMACSVTASNGTGNAELIDGFGFMLNNILGEEDVNPTGAHQWPINTRLASGMCPTLVDMPDGSVVALGSGGSNRIRSAICQVIVHLCLNGDSIQSAVESPRLHVEGDHLDFEDTFGPVIRDRLESAFADHRAWPEANMFYGGVHAAGMIPTGEFSGIGDTRRDGVAIIVD